MPPAPWSSTTWASQVGSGGRQAGRRSELVTPRGCFCQPDMRTAACVWLLHVLLRLALPPCIRAPQSISTLPPCHSTPLQWTRR